MAAAMTGRAGSAIQSAGGRLARPESGAGPAKGAAKAASQSRTGSASSAPGGGTGDGEQGGAAGETVGDIGIERAEAVDDLDRLAALGKAGTGGDGDDGGGDQGDDDSTAAAQACRLVVSAVTRCAQACPRGEQRARGGFLQNGPERFRRAGACPSGGDDGGDGQRQLRRHRHRARG